MPPNLALLIGATFVFFAFRSDRKRDCGDTKGLFWPFLWYLVVASRPLGYWLNLWGVPLPGGSTDATEGSVVDRFFFLTLTVIGLRTLSQRRFDWGATIRQNPWLVALLALMALSILWSDYPYVSFKRYIKVFGSIVMAMVVLSHPDPLSGFTTILRRCLYIHLPMSIICTRYYRDIGVSFDWTGTTEAWIGISTTKNTLGQVAMLGVLYFAWEVKRHWNEYGWRNLHVLYLFMGGYLLKGAEAMSMTSVTVCAFAVTVFLRIQYLRDRPEAIGRFVHFVFCGTAALILFVVIHSIVMFPADSFFGSIITLLGRDITMTDRTYIWNDVYAATEGSPLLGVGYGGFWIGRIANIPWNAYMTWVLGQAHSGYVDTYLQLGFVGVFLLTGVLVSKLPELLASLTTDFDFGCFRITLFLTILFVNMAESTHLRGDHHLWLIFMIVVWKAPQPFEFASAPHVNARRADSKVVRGGGVIESKA
jgi:exopolysaccharide production protein ExoQ